MAIKPILTPKGESRYLENSAELVYKYTAGNPFFLQIVCSRIVDIMNNLKISSVSTNEIQMVVKNLVSGETKMPLSQFDALKSPGKYHGQDSYTANLWRYLESENNTLIVLSAIAQYSRETGWCGESELDAIPHASEIVAALVELKTLEENSHKQIRIRVELFAEWLRANIRR